MVSNAPYRLGVASDDGTPTHRRNPRNMFSAQILKAVVGKERAEQAFNSMSMGHIPYNMASEI